jgi:1-phosphofructokinase
MITTVTLNPAIDKVVEISRLVPGQVHRVSHQVVSLGGKSINVARILTGLNNPTKAICFLGKTNYEEIVMLSKEDQIPLEPIMLDGLTRTNVKVVEPDEAYRTTDINEMGFEVSEARLEEMTAVILKHGEASDYIVLSGSLPRGVGVDYYKQIALKLKEKTKVVIDADGEILMKGMEGAPFMIKPNIHELEAAVGKTIDSEAMIVEVCRELIQTYGLTYILVSRGEDGSVLVGAEIVLSAEVIPVKVLSTVGAGDSMLAGMLYGLAEDSLHNEESLTKALSYGVASSAIAISTMDHKAFDRNMLKDEAQKVKIRVVS